MDEEEDDGGGIPEWVVTFGDMMSLLLTFFIMLVSLSEIKEEEKYQALVESVRQKFGHDLAQLSLAPGPARPRSSAMSRTATMGRARKLDIMKGGNRVQAPAGEFMLVHEIRPTQERAADALLIFDEFSFELTEDHKLALQQLAMQVGGKPQKLDVRGHSTYRPPPPEVARDQYDLATRRAIAVKQFLVKELKLDERRIRLSVAGPYEPLYVGTDPQLLARNPRVEVHVLSEFVNQFRGSEKDRQKQVTQDGAVEP